MSRYFLDEDLREVNEFRLKGPDLHHLKNVMRQKTGDFFTVIDACAWEYEAEILAYEGEEAHAAIVSRAPSESELPVKITLCQALARGEKMDTLIRQAVELGASAVLTFASDHAQVKLSGSKLERRISHWQAVAEAAAKQSGRAMIPEINYLDSTDKMIGFMQNQSVAFVPYEAEKEKSLKAFLKVKGVDENSESLAFAIGPEGGFSARECDLFAESGIETVSLGPRILRTETAGPAVMAVLAAWIEE